MDVTEVTVICPECKNEVKYPDKGYIPGEVLECPFCGSEMEVLEVKEDGTLVVELVEEEK